MQIIFEKRAKGKGQRGESKGRNKESHWSFITGLQNDQ
jgi:hypothetical protein